MRIVNDRALWLVGGLKERSRSDEVVGRTHAG